MNDHQSESQNDGLYDLGAEIYAMSPVNRSRGLDDIGLDELDLGDDPIDPGPLMDAEELTQMAELENRQEVEAETETHDQIIRRLTGGYKEQLRQPKPKTARKSTKAPWQIETARYRAEEGRERRNLYDRTLYGVNKRTNEGYAPRDYVTGLSPEEKAARRKAKDKEQKAAKRAAMTPEQKAAESAKRAARRAKVKMTQTTT